MRNIPTYESFVNEGILQNIKDFVSGVKTDDDRLAKDLLKEVGKFEDVRRGFGRVELSFNFRYNGYLFEIMNGYGKMYPPNKMEPISIKSKFLSKLYSELSSIVNKQEVADRLKKAQEEAKLKDTEFKDILKKHGGIDGIAETILDKIQNPRAYWRGQIRIDRPNTLVMISPIDESKEGRSLINTIIVNLSNGETRMEQSYGAYADHKRYDGKLSSSELKSLNKYVQIANDTAKMKDDEKAEAIRKIINK